MLKHLNSFNENNISDFKGADWGKYNLVSSEYFDNKQDTTNKIQRYLRLIYSLKVKNNAK